MSRSRRRKPIIGNTTARSEKTDKRVAAGILRAKERQAIHHDAEVGPLPREAFDMAWCGEKDGKRWVGRTDGKLMRK